MNLNFYISQLNEKNKGKKSVFSIKLIVVAGLLITISSLIILTGCTGTEEAVTANTPQPTSTEPPTLTPTATDTLTPIPTETPIPTDTPAPIPTETPTPTDTPMPTITPTPPLIDSTWKEKVSGIVWVAYSPPAADPNEGIEASLDSIRDDLAVLHEAGFTGLVTYSSSGVLGRDLPVLAQSQGFEGLIMGIWDPLNEEEVAAAEIAAEFSIVMGFCIGNEGLHKRYEMSDLFEVIQNLRKTTGKPATTTEELEDYLDEDLLNLGDWIFPNVHPYFHSQLEPDMAVEWTQGAYDDFKRRTDRFVIFKEVGLPTEGDLEGKLSEENQDKYYQELENTNVQFIYFEAFDQPWKTHLPVEPHWGIFFSDRSPKLLGRRLMGKEPPPAATPEPAPSPSVEEPLAEEPPSLSISTPPFYIYQDADSPDNHYKPTGYMGDTGDIHINEVFDENPHSGKTSIQIVYDAEGKGPNGCDYTPPCKWAGVYWQEPPNNWGTDEVWAGRGFDLSDYNRLVFWARADQPGDIEFKVGGINQSYGDSLVYPRGILANLTQEWQKFEMDLEGADLTHIIGGFVWSTSWDINPDGITFYLDDIVFDRTPLPDPEPSLPVTVTNPNIFDIYTEFNAPNNHFVPSGHMGDIGDVNINEEYTGDTCSGETAIQISYGAQGAGPSEGCDAYGPPCWWAGAYWQEPENNFGMVSDAGFDLSEYTRLTFCARGETGAERIEFGTGGMGRNADTCESITPHPDSMCKVSREIDLTTEWQEYTLDLSGQDLSNIIGGFLWATSKKANQNGATFYLDDIRFEK